MQREAIALFVLLTALCNCGLTSSMLYKRNEQEKYEADLVPVSSTVIPLTVLEVSYGVGGKPSEEYKVAYLRKLRKKMLLKNAAGQGSATAVDDDGNSSSSSAAATTTTATTANDQPAALPPLPETPAADTLITVKSKQIEAGRSKVTAIER